MLNLPNERPEPDPALQPENGDETTPVDDQGIPDDAYVYALERILKGTRQRDIRRSLERAGYTVKQIEQILRYATSYQKKNEGKVGPVETRENAAAYLVFGFSLWAMGIMARLAGVSTSAATSLVFLTTDLVGLVLVVMGVIKAIRARRNRR